MQAQQQKTKLVLNQKQELEFQHVSEVLEMECGKIHLRGSCQDETNIESDKKKITALESKLADLRSTYEFSDSLVSDLTKKERATNDEWRGTQSGSHGIVLLHLRVGVLNWCFLDLLLGPPARILARGILMS